MESKLARQLQDDLIAAIGRLSPEDRLKAFLAHYRLVTELYEAGRRHRARPSQPAESIRVAGESLDLTLLRRVAERYGRSTRDALEAMLGQ